MMIPNIRTVTCACLLAIMPIAPAWAASEALPWDSLSPQEQQTLKRFHNRWEKLPPERQHRLQKGADRWSKLTPGQRRRVRRKFRRWKKLPPEQRQAIRDRKSVV